MTEWLSSHQDGLLAVAEALLLLGFVAGSAIFFIGLERKVAARIQNRLGPTHGGEHSGWLQTIADGIKSLVEQDHIPTHADPMLYRLGPYIAFGSAFVAFIALPFANTWAAKSLSIGTFFILAVMSTRVFGILLAGSGSGSKWTLFGGMQEAAQMIGYEVSMVLCAIVPVIVAGSMDLNCIALQQAGGIWQWYVFHDPFTFLAFWLYLTCATAQYNCAPFDLAEAESELVADFHTENRGLRWSFFMAEDATMFAVSGLGVLLFLGGWSMGIPFVPELSTTLLGWPLGNTMNVVVFVLKTWLLVFVQMRVRWMLPRLRIDWVMTTCLKYLLPISCTLLMGVSLWQLTVNPVVGPYFGYVLCALCLGLFAWMLVKTMTTPGRFPTSVMEVANLWHRGPIPPESARKT